MPDSNGIEGEPYQTLVVTTLLDFPSKVKLKDVIFSIFI